MNEIKVGDKVHLFHPVFRIYYIVLAKTDGGYVLKSSSGGYRTWAANDMLEKCEVCQECRYRFRCMTE
jgi:hypothetical protein